MTPLGLPQGVIDAFPEPVFLLTPEGGIAAANRAARAMMGPRAAAGSLTALVATPETELARYLARARGGSSLIPGALVFRTPAGERRLRVHCARLGGRNPEALLVMRCTDPRSDRFAMLSERVRQLDSELHRRVREKDALRAALDENRNLTRELQHRVKNNIQMMISLLGMSTADGGSPEVRAFAAGVRNRFRALATTQDLIQESRSSDVIPAGDLLGRLARALEESTDGRVSVEVEAAEIRLPQDSAHCLALIVNELVTNSVKHAFDGAGRVCISLGRQGGQVRLVVQDDGKGYPALDTLARSSGLALIRGLCRQIGAGLELGNDGGARTVIRFADAAARDAGAPGRPEPSPAST